ncbi:MAG TPA: lactonase family protein [Planctomycetota bacterium]|nr:lactonase family protein [Planctomycetota bacterium]HRR81259.1 lactonase family protein [Planctomycetota bacterium]HRT94676.1 lactonase family protein [Planctomycetota bacterium]
MSVLSWLMLLSPALVLSMAAASRAGEAEASARPARVRLYIGTYTWKASKGIYTAELDVATGRLSAPELAAEATNPTFLAIHPSRRFLYAVGEIGNFRGGKSGAISAFAILPESGKLKPLNQQPSGGSGPCHVIVDREGKNALAANYGSGSVAVLPIADDGSLREPSCAIQHQGKGPDPKRQEGPHAHSINLDAAGRFAFAADLGLDKLLIYRFDAAAGKLEPNDPPFASVAPGAGPRHFAFHPNGRFAYVINEMAMTVTAFAYDAGRGALKEIQTVPTLPDGGGPGPGLSTAEVQVHPSGRFVYGSNRGHNTIAIFRVDAETGKLTPVGHESTRGKTPRNFGMDPAGAWLVAANQDSNDLFVFRIDAETGRLAPTGERVEVPLPVCVKFLPVAGD